MSNNENNTENNNESNEEISFEDELITLVGGSGKVQVFVGAESLEDISEEELEFIQEIFEEMDEFEFSKIKRKKNIKGSL